LAEAFGGTQFGGFHDDAMEAVEEYKKSQEEKEG